MRADGKMYWGTRWRDARRWAAAGVGPDKGAWLGEEENDGKEGKQVGGEWGVGGWTDNDGCFLRRGDRGWDGYGISEDVMEGYLANAYGSSAY